MSIAPPLPPDSGESIPRLPAGVDERFMRDAVALALETEARGNLPIAALVTLDGQVVASGLNQSCRPTPHPGRHAEVLALANLPEALIPRLFEMTCYTTLEPCLMCFGALVLHGVGRVVFGANDPLGGAVGLAPTLSPHVARKFADMTWVGPILPELCDPLWQRASSKYWQGDPDIERRSDRWRS